MQDRLIFVIGSPRSGSTLLARMLGAHSAVHAPSEPHLLTPLAHLGYYERVDQAAYEPVITQNAQRELVAALPRGEEDYLDALRALTDTLYERLLAPTGCRMLVDKTPAYALVLDFAAKLYPKAHYVVLTRNPLAVWSSQVASFFDGDHEAAHRTSPVLERYVPAIARFLREKPVALHPVRYEDLVADPAAELERICAFAGLDFEPGMVDYGERREGGEAGAGSASGGRSQAQAEAGLGDPISAGREKRPTTRSVARWKQDMAGDPAKVELAGRILAALPTEDLETWGYRREALEADLASVDTAGRRPKRRALSRYTLQRALLVRLRRNIHHNAFGRLVRRVRTACDVLLR